MSNVILSTSFKKMVIDIYNEHDCRICETIIHYSNNHTASEVNYLTMRGNMISFLPAGKEHKVNEEGKWSRDGRQDGKPARVIRKIFPPELVSHMYIIDAHYEKFSNYVSAYVGINGDGDGGSDPVYKIAVCNGEFISEYYNHNANGHDAGGNLTGSCMRHVESEYFDIYVYNPDTVSMAVCLDGHHKVHGRALIWKTDKGLCMDTIYAADSIKNMFISFAKENGMRYKSQQSCHWNSFDVFNGVNDNNSQQFTAVLRDCYEPDYYPYLDTMQYLCTDTGRISNRNNGMSEWRELRCTNGGYDDSSPRVECMLTGDMIDEDDAVYLDYRDHGGRYREGYVHQDRVIDTDCGYRLEDDSVYISRRGHYALDSELIVYSEYEGDYIHIDDAVCLRDGDWIHCNNAREVSNGDYVHEDDAVELHDGTWEEESDTVCLWDGQYALADDCTLCNNTGLWYLIGTYSNVETKSIETI